MKLKSNPLWLKQAVRKFTGRYENNTDTVCRSGRRKDI